MILALMILPLMRSRATGGFAPTAGDGKMAGETGSSSDAAAS
jgi:hypothetical protein